MLVLRGALGRDEIDVGQGPRIRPLGQVRIALVAIEDAGDCDDDENHQRYDEVANDLRAPLRRRVIAIRRIFGNVVRM